MQKCISFKCIRQSGMNGLALMTLSHECKSECLEELLSWGAVLLCTHEMCPPITAFKCIIRCTFKSEWMNELEAWWEWGCQSVHINYTHQKRVVCGMLWIGMLWIGGNCRQLVWFGLVKKPLKAFGENCDWFRLVWWRPALKKSLLRFSRVSFWWKLWVIDWSAGFGSSAASHVCMAALVIVIIVIVV